MKYISIAFGGDEDRYKCALILATSLHRGNVIGSSHEWQLHVVMKKTSYSFTYKQLLEALGATVHYVSVSNPLEYSLERYKIHDSPGVTRWIAVDSHYLWTPAKVQEFQHTLDAWEDSEKPIIAYKWPKMSQSKKPFAGGFFGSTTDSDIGNMHDLLREYMGTKSFVYGDDEKFLGWLTTKDEPVIDYYDEIFFAKHWPSTNTLRMLSLGFSPLKFKRLVKDANEYSTSVLQSADTEEESY